MKYIFSFVVYILVTVISSNGQQLSPHTINNAGQFRSAGGAQLEDALGGFAVSTIGTSTFLYTQDFLQPDKGSTTTIPLINNVILNSGAGIDNAGTTFINGNSMLEFTLGEVASITHSSANNVLTQGILQPLPVGVTLPVTGLEFYTKRLNNTTVHLEWKTLQEINNRGFHIERKKEIEGDFADIGFVSSNALGGNSSLPLSYVKTDANAYTGNTYYRLKQEDIDGRITYSLIRIVKGDVSKQLTMQVWPVPSASSVNVLVGGLEKPDMLMVFDLSGKLIKQHIIQHNIQVQLNSLTPGTYILRLADTKDVAEKIVVQ
ncbi:MAG: hypothetical protein RIR12_1442 [Bacteroidota bacterium]|jgi:hypothetical protein